MRHLIILAALCLLTTTAWCQTSAPASAPQPTRLPIPDLALQAQSQDTIHQMFAPDFARTAPADLQTLARKLLTQAAQMPDQSAARYVALLDAADLSAAAGDAATAVQAIDELGRHYQVAHLDMRRAALLRAADNATAETQFQTLVPLALETADLAAAADSYDGVLPLVNLAETAANKSRQLNLVASIQLHLADLRSLALEYVDVKAALARLEAAPDDPRAHLTVGRYYALSKGQWERGLSHLGKGSDVQLADLAARELAKPADGLAQAMLADDWWNYAEKVSGPARPRVTAHATELYKSALQTLKGSTLARIQSRIDQGTAAAPPPQNPAATVPTGGTVAFLPLIDVAKDASQGQWSRGPDGITCASSAYACLQLPYMPPEEYDLTATFARTADDGSIALLLAAQKRAFEFVLDIKSEARFERVNGKVAQDNPTVMPVAISNGHRYTLTVEVRSDHVRALLDGKELCTYKTDLKDLTRYSNWKLGDNALCGIGANGAKVTFYSIDLVEVKGKGKATR